MDGDDGEIWRHGGLMEARIRDWLTSKIEEERQEAQSNVHPYYCTSATYSSGVSETWDSQVYEIAGESYEEDSYNDANIVATYSSEFSETWDNTLQDALSYAGEEPEESTEVDNQGYIGANMASTAAILAAPLVTQAHYYYQFSGDLQGGELHEEDDDQICAVCLEKLYVNEELQGVSINNITRLPCRHSFHSPCLSPWLSASSFCPCCRAPISPLHLEAPSNLGLNTPSANCSDEVQLDMMGLLAEMEAALDRFGLLS